MEDIEIQNRFVYHAPTPKKEQLHKGVRGNICAVAQYLNFHLPEGREKSLALTKLEEAMFWANAAIARESNE